MVRFFWKHGRENVIILLLFISIILMITHTSFSVNYLKKGIANVLIPFQIFASQMKFSARDFFLSIQELRDVKLENKRLRKTIRIVHAEKQKYQKALQENQRLKSLLGYKEQLPYKSIAARVISYDPSNWENTIMIDKGKKDGIYHMAPVVAYQDRREGLVGRVLDVNANSSSVLLLYDQNSMIGGEILRTQYKGIIEGDNYRYCSLKYLPYDAVVKKKDIIITSGDGGIFPKGLFIGFVVNVGRKERGLFRDVTILPFIKFSKLEEVIVIINEQNLAIRKAESVIGDQVIRVAPSIPITDNR
ncbi:rod shape-determining protein MreC [Candidatus Desantisbacteria bacterium CG_4_8_14_3_um_filter_40_12]|uniref:Cell shape-determining protein MreC n=3 Tax=unclassified Candidatus Desantisiibacteriota TaxID=3106372 RepID=A0A2M7JA23_9BACT|nr:MAG: rod shape-determining protein MreC [Candidatus Desantisbacteria bacterium CG23_combo_of_CG06-09_8_20_14_all_40_23]PIX16258.1 MAG: rod shape-determining protein MreC [Candidatus Desantisbacteria bacterium CG_4_8_14_3_um_filter_40_12]PIY19673.1 MAG: rod shape-determining protein MreC [Candidatus Desantisbacteria bacterium CG_4_10_14_3_um_filter_40_18]